MTQLAPPQYSVIEDQIDAVGQKYRAQRIIRGAMLWVAFGIAVSLAAALLAHFTGTSFWTRVIFGAWLAWLLVSGWRWFIKPLLIKPDPVEVARHIESRIDGLHNALTNGLLLARREDIKD